MASEKEGVVKLDGSIVRQETLLSREEVKAKEIRTLNKVMELKNFLRFIEEAQIEIDKLEEQQQLQSKWQIFLSCNPLPKAYIPPDIHLFFAKLKHWEEENVQNNISWLLSVNEKSMLSQDIFRQDLTSQKLSAELRKNIGHEYNGYIRDSFSILKRIEYFLNNKAEVAKCPARVFDDIIKHKLAIQQEIENFMDRLTYRIIKSENAEMNSIDAITAEYFFKALDFDIHIWCLKNVAIRFSYLSEPRLMADFKSINLKLQIPAEMLKENLVVRALHMKFDHFSESAKSFKQQLATSAENFDFGTLNLPNCLLSEWSMQVDMQIKKTNEMKLKCSDYESLKRQYMEQLEKQKQQSRDEENTRKKAKLTKMPKAPLCIEGDMVPDIYEEFLEEEQKQYERVAKTPFEPELLKLTADEVNLRKYVIINGVYQLYYIKKPIHADYESFNMTWHQNESKLEIEKNIKISSTNVSRSGTRPTGFTRRMSVVEVNKRLGEQDIDCPWFVLRFELPEHLCHWSNPMPCHFEETTTAFEQPEFKDAAEPKHSVNKPDSVSPSNSKKDNQLIDSNASMAANLKSVQIDDFSLLEVLTKPHIRHIERHILPRIISSYKFPKEIQQEDSELLSNKPKGKTGRILRQKTSDVQQQFSNKKFAFDDRQNNPERIYTIFEKAENVHITELLKELDLLTEDEPETFAQLLYVIKDIKSKCKLKVNSILDLKPIAQKIVTQNKRIKQMRKQKERTSKLLSIIASDHTATADTELKPPETSKTDEAKMHCTKENDESSAMLEGEQNVQELQMIKYSHWTTKHILKSQFDRTNRQFTIHTDRLGNFGFAFKRYEHFPFKCWTMEPSENNTIVFTLDTQYVRCVLYITADGVCGHVIEQMKAFKSNPKKYLEIKTPIKDFNELKRLFMENCLNIFAENDAGFYIENGYFSEKHLANELHTYSCMAVHITQMSFSYSSWNRLALRRDIILKFRQYQDLPDNLVEVRVTPGEAYFVEIQELCSEDLNIIRLHYNLTWRNIESYSDLHHLIVSMYPAATDLRCKNSKLICNVRDLLREIKPLSFS